MQILPNTLYDLEKLKLSLTVFFVVICLGLPLTAAEPKALKDTMSVEYRCDRPYPNHGVTIVGALEALGVSPEKIDDLKLVGDKNSMTAGLTKKMKMKEFFWDQYFATAEPYKFWLPSGYRHLEIYVKGEAKAKTTIYINETDSCFVSVTKVPS